MLLTSFGKHPNNRPLNFSTRLTAFYGTILNAQKLLPDASRKKKASFLSRSQSMMNGQQNSLSSRFTGKVFSNPLICVPLENGCFIVFWRRMFCLPVVDLTDIWKRDSFFQRVCFEKTRQNPLTGKNRSSFFMCHDAYGWF